MRAFRYDTSGTWYKGNTHVHTTASDGGKTADEVAAMYARAGYDFLFRADHWVVSDVAAEADEAGGDGPLLWLDGMELDGHDARGAYYHVVCLGTFEGISQEMGLPAGLKAARAQGGLLILAHPHWTGNSLADARQWAFHGVEVYNHVCHWLNGKSSGTVHWEAMLRRRPGTLAFAVDDAHLRPEHPGWNGGWVMVNAPTCSRPAVLDALRTGNFYSTCGPEFHAIEWDDPTLTVRTSPVQFVRLAGPGSLGQRVGSFAGELTAAAALEVPADWPYAYVEIEDAQGRRAWTNPLFV